MPLDLEWTEIISGRPFIVGILGLLILIFAQKAVRTKHIVPYFLLSFISAFFGSTIFLILSWLFPQISIIRITPLEIFFYGFYLFFLYLFLESLQKLRLSHTRFHIILIIFVIQQFSLVLLFLFDFKSDINRNIWFIVDLCYDTFGIFVHGWIGIPFYLKNYRYSQKKSSLLLLIAFFLNSLGYLLLLQMDIFWYYNLFSTFRNIVFNLANFLTIIGLLFILVVYIQNIHHFYQIPQDTFIFMISDKKGNIIFTSQFNILKKDKIAKLPISDLLTELNTIFNELLKSTSPVKLFISEDISMIREMGEKFSTIILSRSLSRIMVSALRRFLSSFENLNKAKPQAYFESSGFIQETVDLLVENFPFLINHQNKEHF